VSTFSEQLWNLPADLNASLLHGAVCGLLCAAPAESSQSYRRALTDLLDAVERMDAEELDRFVWYAADDLAAPDLSFTPLLPDDEYSLEDRVEALGQWSEGFLTAFESAAGEVEGEAVDALEDIGRIADVGGDLEDDDDNEFDFVSVVEHLKVAVLLIHDAAQSSDEEEEEESDDDESE
jgi:uncharacterized protein YgfB (UPF0149 family)